MGPNPQDQLWRASRAARATAWVALAAGIAGTVAFGLTHQFYPAVAAAALCVVAWRWGLHPALAATAAGIEVRNPVRTLRIAWDDFEGAVPGTAGIILLREDRRPVKAWAVQKSSLSHWFGRPVRADEVAHYLAQRARNR